MARFSIGNFLRHIYHHSIVVVHNTLCGMKNNTRHDIWFCLFIIMKTYLYNFGPLKPHFYIVKLGFTRVYIIFLITAQKHRLWVMANAYLSKLPFPLWYLEIICSIMAVIELCAIEHTSVFLKHLKLLVKYCETNKVNSILLHKAKKCARNCYLRFIIK